MTGPAVTGTASAPGRDRSIPGLPPFPWVIPNAHCVNCGTALGWVDGVGRLVIRHADTFSAQCPSTSLSIRPEDLSSANEIYASMDATLRAQAASND